MMETATRNQTAVAMALGGLVVLEAVVFLLAALLHVGVRVPVGFVEPRIIPAAIVEGLIGVFFAVSAYAVFARQTWAWSAAIGAHVFALLGTLLGVFALAVGGGPRTEANTIYHYVMLGVIIVGLVLLLTPIARAALGRGSRASSRR
jgi:hypothetical protein